MTASTPPRATPPRRPPRPRPPQRRSRRHEPVGSRPPSAAAAPGGVMRWWPPLATQRIGIGQQPRAQGARCQLGCCACAMVAHSSTGQLCPANKKERGKHKSMLPHTEQQVARSLTLQCTADGMPQRWHASAPSAPAQACARLDVPKSSHRQWQRWCMCGGHKIVTCVGARSDEREDEHRSMLLAKKARTANRGLCGRRLLSRA